MTTLDYKNAIVRIYYLDSKILKGAGVLVQPDLIITCAHVVNQALGFNPYRESCPDENANIVFDFPNIDNTGDLDFSATVRGWESVKNNPGVDDVSDLALLKLKTPLPAHYQPLALFELDTDAKVELDLYGFPEKDDKGDPIEAKSFGKRADGFYKIKPLNNESIEPGFSGTAVYYPDKQAVVGLLGYIKTATKDGYFIPSQKIVTAFPELQKCLISNRAKQAGQADTKPSQEIYNCYKNMAKFIARPEDAYQHVLDKVEASNVVGVCSCFHTSDKPEDFAKSMVSRLTLPHHASLHLDLIELPTSSIKRLNFNIKRKAISQEGFYLDCLSTLWKGLREDKQPTGLAGKKPIELIEYYSVGILEKLNSYSAYKPIIFLAEINISAWFGLNNQLALLKQCSLWIDAFHKDWQQVTAQITAKNKIVILFMFKLNTPFIDKIQKCFNLIKISNEEISNWLTEVNNLIASKYEDDIRFDQEDLDAVYNDFMALYEIVWVVYSIRYEQRIFIYVSLRA